MFYTFRTFPWKEQLEDPFVFEKIKQDLVRFEQLLLETKPQLIIGVAKTPFKKSISEGIVINRFNRGVINTEGKGSYELDLLPNLDFRVRNSGTNTFCNYVAYRIEEMIEKHQLECRHAFVHVSEKDVKQNLVIRTSYFGIV